MHNFNLVVGRLVGTAIAKRQIADLARSTTYKAYEASVSKLYHTVNADVGNLGFNIEGLLPDELDIGPPRGLIIALCRAAYKRTAAIRNDA